MDEGASSNAAAFVGAGDEEKQLKAIYEIQAQKVARLQALVAFGKAEIQAQKVARLQALVAFGKAAHAEAMRYSDMEEEEKVVEEYRRAGKLHTYDMDKEWKKRFARVAKLHPCPWGKQTATEVAEYTYYLEEDEDDFSIGLYSLVGE